MLRRYLIALAISPLTLPATALAEDAGFFAGLDATGGIAFGSSSTTDGGAPFAGGGIVDNVKFRGTVGLGGSSATISHRRFRHSSATGRFKAASVGMRISRWSALPPGSTAPP